MPRALNALAAAGPLRRIGLRAAGIDPRRPIPALADSSFRRAFRRNRQRGRVEHAGMKGVGVPGPVMLWVDTFTDAFDPEIARAAVELIESLGHEVRIPERRVCCGLTWISTGQLDGARKRLRATVAALDEHVRAGGVVVGLEPSCTAALRADLPRLLPDDDRAAAVASAVRTLAEFLEAEPGWQPPDRTGQTVIVQPHCHEHAVSGFAADRRILEGTGATVRELSGCCGLAGNFGMQRGHYEVSVAVAENGLLPALRDAAPDTILIADGFSCRTQADQLAGRSAQHLAQFLGRAPNGRS